MNDEKNEELLNLITEIYRIAYAEGLHAGIEEGLKQAIKCLKSLKSND